MTMTNQTVDLNVIRAEQAAFEVKCNALKRTGQRLLAKIRPTSKYFGQGDENRLFPVAVASKEEYGVIGGPGGQYRLRDVDLFVVFSDEAEPIQITFEK